MTMHSISRRRFIQISTAAAGAALAPAISAAAPQRTATDTVALGKTGLTISRLGMGTGSNSGNVQYGLGQEAFNKLVHYAFERGITYFDCAKSYRTFEWIAGAIKGLPRERLFLQSKIGGQPENVLAEIDRHRKVFDTDYVDSMLVHCMIKSGWTDDWKRIMEAYDEAKSRKWIRAKGVSCHSLPALQAAAASDWTEVHLVRINPQGHVIDTPEQAVNAPSDASHVEPVMAEIRKMHAKGHGVIGMKLVGDGDFTKPEDREKAARFAMSQPEIHAVVIGFKSPAEIDEAIDRLNRALAAT